MAPVLDFSINPLDSVVSGSLLFLRILLCFIGYVALKLTFKTFVSPRFSTLRSVPGPPSEKAWSGAMGEALSRPTGEAFHDWHKKHGGAVRFPTAFGSDALLLTDPAALHHIFVDRAYDYIKPVMNASAIGDVSGPGLIVVEGDSHKRQRKLMLPSFGPAHLRALAPVIVEKSKELRKQWIGVVAESTIEPGTFKTVAETEEARRSLPKNEAVVEVQGWFNKLTLDIIGLAGFGHSFDTLSSESSTLSSSWDAFSARVSAKPTPFSFLFTRLVRTLAHIGKPIDLERFIPVERIQVDRRLRRSLEEESRIIIDAKIKEVEAEGKESLEESKDLIALLLRANWGETKAPLSNEELRAEMMTILLAGHETTSNALSWLFLELARSPRIQNKLRSELVAAQQAAEEGGNEDIELGDLDKLEYLDAVVHEIFRFEPSIGATTREALTSDQIPLSKPVQSATNPLETLSSVPVKKGTQLIVPIWSANRCRETYGEDAEEFRPERWVERDGEGEKVVKGGNGLYNLQTFIQGPRSCIGYKFAIMEIKIALATLLPTFTFALREPNQVVERRAEVVTRSIMDGDKMGLVLRVGLAKGE